MYSTDTLVKILEECREGESPAFVLVEVDGLLHVTPRSRPEASPVTIARDPFGYAIHFTCATRRPTSPRRRSTEFCSVPKTQTETQKTTGRCNGNALKRTQGSPGELRLRRGPARGRTPHRPEDLQDETIVEIVRVEHGEPLWEWGELVEVDPDQHPNDPGDVAARIDEVINSAGDGPRLAQ